MHIAGSQPPPSIPEIAALFTKVFEREVGPDDDFFDLEGDSFLGATLATLLQERFDYELSLSALLEAPTPRALTKRMLAGASKRAATLRACQTEGAPPTIICAHGNIGETSFAVHLSRTMQNPHPFFALRATGLEPGELPELTMDDVVGGHLKNIRKQKLRAPYLVIGTCAGSIIAHELARRLAEQGNETSLVLVDPDINVEWAPFLYRSGLELTLFQSSWRNREQQIRSHMKPGPSEDGEVRLALTAAAIKHVVATHTPMSFPGRCLLICTERTERALTDPVRGYPSLVEDIDVKKSPHDHVTIFTEGIGHTAGLIESFIADLHSD